MRADDGDVEAPPHAACRRKSVEHETLEIRRQPRIGVQKQQNVGVGRPRAGVHLRGAAARGRDDEIGER